MGYLILVLGVAIWWVAHLFKRVAPERRAAMGNKGRGLVAAALGLSIVLMVIGFKQAEHIDFWYPPSMMIHANNLLVLIAIWMMSPAGQKGKLLQGVRHPMLMGFGIWAAAHLLVNGDLASVVLFGGLLAWAVAEVVVINAAEPEWEPRTDGSIAKDGMFMAGSVVLLAVIGYIHGWLGYWPFP